LQAVQPKVPPGDKEKIALILGLLGSEHDGEVVAAARQAERLRQKIGTTWIELLSAALA
jgi:hypothetical protein